MATYPINQDNPPTGAGYQPGDIVTCPDWSVVPSWLYVGDEQWVPNDTARVVTDPITGMVEILGPGGAPVIVIAAAAPSDADGRSDGVVYIQTEA